MNENEVKFRIRGLKKIEERLKNMKAEYIRLDFEKNFLFDRKGRLTDEKRLLRIREINGKIALITYKGPRHNPESILKSRPEEETSIGNAKTMKKILEGVGFAQYFAYEKERAIYILNGMEIALDKIPILGRFGEIEAKKENITEEQIFELAYDLGITDEDFTTLSYPHLAREYFKEKGLELQDLRF